MNPSWITGTMPEQMYEHEHPGHLEEARRETEDAIQRQLERVRRREAADEEAESRGEGPEAPPEGGPGVE
jgi:hypothetical protein